jgi:hypothetical protein
MMTNCHLSMNLMELVVAFLQQSKKMKIPLDFDCQKNENSLQVFEYLLPREKMCHELTRKGFLLS